jgi:dihydroflavonol-4-reductase
LGPPVFLTGGSGSVGGALLRRLVADGREVRALARSPEAAETLRGLGARPVPGDLFDRAALLEGMRGCETVFHAAGITRMCPRDPSPMMRVNVEGAAGVVRIAAAAKARRVVATSSAAAIGEPAGIVADERTQHRGSFLSWYERSKFLGERRMLALGEELRLPVVCVNPASVQGPGRLSGSARLLLDLVNGRLPVLVNTWLSVVDIDDCTAAHVLAETRGVPGQRYLVSGASLDVRAAVELLRSVCGRPARAWFAPRRLASVAGTIGAAAGRLLRSDPPVCPEMVRTLLHGHRFDGSLAERELGLRYTPLEETVRRTLDWYAARGLAPHPAGSPPSRPTLG